MLIELVGGPRDGEWIDTQDLPSWDVEEYPAMLKRMLDEKSEPKKRP